jgi:hypothetical protein
MQSLPTHKRFSYSSVLFSIIAVVIIFTKTSLDEKYEPSKIFKTRLNIANSKHEIFKTRLNIANSKHEIFKTQYCFNRGIDTDNRTVSES